MGSSPPPRPSPLSPLPPSHSGLGADARDPRRCRPARLPAVRLRPGGVGRRFPAAARVEPGGPAASPPRPGLLLGRQLGLHGADGGAWGWGGGRVPGRPAGTGTAPDHFGPESRSCQEGAATAAAIFRGLKMAAVRRPANRETAGGCWETGGPAPRARARTRESSTVGGLGFLPPGSPVGTHATGQGERQPEAGPTTRGWAAGEIGRDDPN